MKQTSDRIIVYCEIIIDIISPPFVWIFRYSGLEFILRKFHPSESRKRLPTGFIWIIGIYVAFFGVASQRYENRVDLIENRANSLFLQLAIENVRTKALSRIAEVQNMTCPMKPEILSPTTVFRSLFVDNKYLIIVDIIKTTVEDWKNELATANLSEIDLSDSDLSHANLRTANLTRAILRSANLLEANLMNARLIGADISHADLSGSWFNGANFNGANLYEADLSYSDLSAAVFDEADMRLAGLLYTTLKSTKFRKAKLMGADFGESDFTMADLRSADLRYADLRLVKNLKVEQLCVAETLYGTKLDNDLKKAVEKKCHHLLEKRPS